MADIEFSPPSLPGNSNIGITETEGKTVKHGKTNLLAPQKLRIFYLTVRSRDLRFVNLAKIASGETMEFLRIIPPEITRHFDMVIRRIVPVQNVPYYFEEHIVFL